jgi:hypothetical protein
MFIAFLGLSMGMFGSEPYPGKSGLVIRLGFFLLGVCVFVSPLFFGWALTSIPALIVLILPLFLRYLHRRSEQT